jgi:hypothetical protein
MEGLVRIKAIVGLSNERLGSNAPLKAISGETTQWRLAKFALDVHAF